MNPSRQSVLIVTNTDGFFLSHRLPIARAAKDRGHDVAIAAADTGHAQKIRDLGFSYYDVPFRRAWASPIDEVKSLVRLVRVCRSHKPSLLHLITIKPVVYGWVASMICGRPAVVNALTGLGFTFTGGMRARLARLVLAPLLRFALHNRAGCTILQNPDDLQLLRKMRIVDEHRAVVIRGSGVDCSRFHPTDSRDAEIAVVLASRMLRDKGIPEFVRMARSLRTRFPEVRFVLVGDVDPGNPRSLQREELLAWVDEGMVEWWGHQEDMTLVLAKASVFVLPTTYREGVPMVLLEAAASGLAIVTTDAPGCREIVRHRVNGLLVPPGDESALAGAVAELVGSRELRERFGRAGRDIAVAEFRVEHVAERTMDVYAKLLEERE